VGDHLAPKSCRIEASPWRQQIDAGTVRNMSSETIRLRAPRPRDREVWGDPSTGYLNYYETRLPPAVHDAAFAQLASDDPATLSGLLACGGDRALGLVHRAFHPQMWRSEGIRYLRDLFTVPAARGRGVGRRLIEAVYQAAGARGTPHLYWLTQEHNAPGRALYDRVGRLAPFIRCDRPAP
jgi:GNAT superfamily N-acetyltransferase